MFDARLSYPSIVAAVLTALPVHLHAADHTDNARVVSSTPIVERVREPRQECTPDATSQHAPQAERSVIAPIIGGVAGALLGSTVGRGSGRDAATAAGAIAGAVAGDRIDNRQTAAAPPAQNCRTAETTREIILGYTVVYQYNGHGITTTLPYDPGTTVRVGVSVIEGGNAASAPTAAMPGGNAREVAAPAEPRYTTSADLRPAQPNYSCRY